MSKNLFFVSQCWSCRIRFRLHRASLSAAHARAPLFVVPRFTIALFCIKSFILKDLHLEVDNHNYGACKQTLLTEHQARSPSYIMLWMNTYIRSRSCNNQVSYIKCIHNKENFYYIDASPSPERDKFQSSVMRAYRRRRIAPPGTPLSSYHYTHYFCLFKRALIVCYYNLHQWLTSS